MDSSLEAILSFLSQSGLESTRDALLSELRQKAERDPTTAGLSLPSQGFQAHERVPSAPQAAEPRAGQAGFTWHSQKAGSNSGAFLQQSPPWGDSANEYEGPEDVGYERQDVSGQQSFVDAELDLQSEPESGPRLQSPSPHSRTANTSQDEGGYSDSGGSVGSDMHAPGSGYAHQPSSGSTTGLQQDLLDLHLSRASSSGKGQQSLPADAIWDMGPVGIRIADPVTTPTKSSQHGDEPKPVLSRVESLSSSFMDFDIEREDEQPSSRRVSGTFLNESDSGASAPALEVIDFNLLPLAQAKPQDLEALSLQAAQPIVFSPGPGSTQGLEPGGPFLLFPPVSARSSTTGAVTDLQQNSTGTRVDVKEMGGFSFPVTAASSVIAAADPKLFNPWPSARSSATSEVVAASDYEHMVAADYVDDEYLRSFSKPTSRSTSQFFEKSNRPSSSAWAEEDGTAEAWSFQLPSRRDSHQDTSSRASLEASPTSREPSLDLLPPIVATDTSGAGASCISEPTSSAQQQGRGQPAAASSLSADAEVAKAMAEGLTFAGLSLADHDSHPQTSPPVADKPDEKRQPLADLPALALQVPYAPFTCPPLLPFPPSPELPSPSKQGVSSTEDIPILPEATLAPNILPQPCIPLSPTPPDNPPSVTLSSLPNPAPPSSPVLSDSAKQVASHVIFPDSPPLTPLEATSVWDTSSGGAGALPAPPQLDFSTHLNTETDAEDLFHDTHSGSHSPGSPASHQGAISAAEDGDDEQEDTDEEEEDEERITEMSRDPADMQVYDGLNMDWQELQLDHPPAVPGSPQPSQPGGLMPPYTINEDGSMTYMYDPDYISRKYETLELRVYHRRNRTGFEETKDFPIRINDLIAGRYQIVEFLGSAAFSRAVQALDLKTGMLVCLKIIKNNKDYLDQSLDEIKLLQYVNNMDPHDKYSIVRLYDFFYYKEHLFLVCELLRANLYEFQKYNRESGDAPYFTNSRIQKIARQVLRSLCFLHALGLIHSDLKPENILIKSYSRCEVKVIDLGSSCFVTDQLSSYVQSRSYRAPEVIMGLPYDQKVDIWSLGCILAELSSGQVLFQNDSLATLLARMEGILGPMPRWMLQEGRYTSRYFTRSGQLFERNPQTERFELLVPKRTSLRHRLVDADEGLLSFVSHLLNEDPRKRPTAAQALHHPWLHTEYPEEGAA